MEDENLAYEQKDDEIVLFKNKERKTDQDPLYNGHGMAGGVPIWASGWINESKAGDKYMRIKLRPKQDRPVLKAGQSVGGFIDDEILY
jgi:hypothetical protein